MRFQPSVKEYLAGDKFDNGLRIRISGSGGRIPSRIDYLVQLCAGKNVIHVGCLDHIPLIEKKIARGTWLHSRLGTAARQCLGIDINREGISFVAEKFGVDNVIYNDVVRDPIPDDVKASHWDYMVLGEVLEHIDNPVQFLDSIRSKYAAFVDRIVVTVPNAFRIENFLSAIRGREFVSSDHRFWFTPYTLAKVFSQSGLSDIEFTLAQSYPIPTVYFPKEVLLRRSPALRDTVIMSAKLAE